MSEVAKLDEDPYGHIPTPEEAYETLAALSRLRSSRVTIPKTHKFSRSDVVNSFASAFEMIGGTTRLALWANENPTEFYRLFGKLLPSATVTELVHRPNDGSIKSYTTEELEAMLNDTVVEVDFTRVESDD